MNVNQKELATRITQPLYILLSQFLFRLVCSTVMFQVCVSNF